MGFWKSVFVGITIVIILGIASYFADWVFLSKLDSWLVYEQFVNDDVYYRESLHLSNKGLVTLENIDIISPDFDAYKFPEIKDSFGTENCKVILPTYRNIQVHCDKIYKNGNLLVEWTSINSPENTRDNIIYSINRLNLVQLPYISYLRIDYFGSYNITKGEDNVCPENYTQSNDYCVPTPPKGIEILKVKPLREIFYENSVAISRFYLWGTEKYLYSFISRWYNSTGIEIGKFTNASRLGENKIWYIWYTNPKDDDNITWINSIKVIWSENSTEKNTSFRLIKNETLLPFLRKTDCVDWNSDIILTTLNTISWNSNTELNQSKDILTWLRSTNITVDSYNSTLNFVSRTRAIGIPSRMLVGLNEIGFSHYWAEVYLPNSTWSPVDVSSDFEIGKYSVTYNKNITILAC